MNVVPVLGTGGLRLPLGTRVTKTKHARRGGNPYPPEMREMVRALWLDSGNAALRTPHWISYGCRILPSFRILPRA
jgi:hypothetical protein